MLLRSITLENVRSFLESTTLTLNQRLTILVGPNDLLRAASVPFSIIADLDYVEQIGPPLLKALFKVNPSGLKADITNPRGLDGAALLASIERGIETNDFSEAASALEYMKSRRRRLRSDLSKSEKAKLRAFIKVAAKSDTYLLSRGALESYLPPALARKDIQELVRFVAEDDFWRSLDADAWEEYRGIVLSAAEVG